MQVSNFSKDMKMKKILLVLVAIGLISTSCEKFLEQSSQDLIRPVSVEHYKELLQGEAYFKDIYRHGWFVDIMTDNIHAQDLVLATTVVNTKLEFAGHAYKWAEELEDPTGTFVDRLFQTLYKNILPANASLLVIDELEGTEEEREVLRGQAHFTRAYGYFVLANLYAQAYNEAADTDLCIPLITNTTPTLRGYPRATMKEVWDLITSDIETAVAALESDLGFRTVYEINYRAALILATRVFLYKEDYEKVLEYGEKFMRTNTPLKNISAITSSPSSGGAGAVDKAFLYYGTNPEIVFTFGRLTTQAGEGGYLYYSNEITGLSPINFSVSQGVYSPLIETYGPGDRRKNHWFQQPSGLPGGFFAKPFYSPMKVNYYDLSRTSQSFRSAEVYLNMAEAYARKSAPDQTKALELLNELRRNRIAGYTNLTAADLTGGNSLVNFVWEERRRELCFEEFHRWWDLRRTGQPMLQHEILGEVYVLQEKDPAYVLNFPLGEREFDPDLIPNLRPVRNPINN